MTYQQGALPPGQGYPGQGEQQMYSGGSQDGYGYQQQPQQHQIPQQHDLRYQQNGMYGHGMSHGQQFYHGQQAQQGQYMPSHPQHAQHHPPHQQMQQQQYGGGSMGSGTYQGYQAGYASQMQQPTARQFTPPANSWQQQQQSVHQPISMPQEIQQPMNQHAQSMHHLQQPHQQQRQIQQQQQQQHAMQQIQHMRQQQQQQQHQSPQMYHSAISSPQLQQRQQPSPSPRPQSMTPQQQIQQQFQRRISQSPIPQPSPQPRQMTPRQLSSTPQPVYQEHSQQVQQGHSQQQHAQQQYYQQQTYSQPSPHQQHQQLQPSPQHQHQQLQPSPQHQHQQLQPSPQHQHQQLQPSPQHQHQQLQPSPQHQHQQLQPSPQHQHQQLQPSPQIHTQHQSQRPRQQSTPQPLPETVQEPQRALQTEEAFQLPSQEPTQPEPRQAPPPPADENQVSQHSTDTNEEQLVHDQLQNEQFHFVNLQDIQKLPPLPPMPSLDLQSIDPRDLSLPPAVKEPDLDNIIVKTEKDQDTPMRNAPQPPPKPDTAKHEQTRPEPPRTDPQVRVKTSPHSSVSNSPSITARSPSIAKRSPAVPPKPRPVNTVPLMAAVAEECLEKARSISHDIAMDLEPEDVAEYQKLIATGLSCLEALLQQGRLSPREEGRVRLRYATVLHEETDNMMEAETAFTKGISLCDKHRLLDLKYSMQYSMLQLLFHRNNKAALKAVDSHISNCEAFKHVPWYYAFRLLKASFYMEMGNGSDASALENIRAIQNVATTRGDSALSILASLWEGLALLKTAKEGSMEKVQGCIAQAAKYQFDPSLRIPQLDILMLLLDFAASLHYPNPEATSQKLRDLQRRLDGCEDWNNVRSDFLVPIKKQSASSQILSTETSAILIPNDGTGDYDQIVVSFMTKMELRSLVFTFSGLSSLHKQSSRTNEFWREGLKILETWDQSTAGIPYGPPVSLHTAIKQRTWRLEGQAYLCVLLGLLAASHCQWGAVKDYMDKLEALVSEESQATIRLLSVYLTGVYYQGIGDLTTALNIFSNECFTSVQNGGFGLKVGQQEVALLAGLNRLWIMQHESCRNEADTVNLIEQLQGACTNHWNIDLRTAWHNVMAALVTDPPQQLNQQKQHIQAAMGGSKVTNNLISSAVTLCIMRSRFFENVIGDQALKSARAAAKQAQRTGNVLWQSVADGMLAHSYDVQGQREESKLELEKATTEARDAFNRS